MDTGAITHASATEKSDRLQRCLSWVQDCKRAVNELRSDVKAAISNREKCCMVLSAAMAACLALESLVYSGKVDSTKEQQLQRLCAKVTSTVDLAGARVKVYGQQNKLAKYCKIFRKQHTIDKFDAVITQLDEHSETAWQLADPNNQMPLRRRNLRSSFSQGLQNSGQPSAAADKDLCDSAKQTDSGACHEAPLTRCRLRRGMRHNGVRCMVFINPETSVHAGTLGHIWWYIAGAVGGTLYMHDLATSSVIELEDARKEPPVSTMHHDGQGHVWIGYKGGTVQVWSESSHTPVTTSLKCFHADIRVLVTDGQGAAWAGSGSGNVKRIDLRRVQATGGSTTFTLEHVSTLRHQGKSRRSSIVFSSSASAELDDLSRAGSAHASDDMSAVEEPHMVTAGVRAHTGPVTAIETHRNWIFTSGGTHSSSALHQWTRNGVLHHSHKLKDLGVARAIRALRPIVHVRLAVNMTGRRSSGLAFEGLDTSSLSSVDTQSPKPGSRQSDSQIVTAHDNGQVQVWDMSTGTLQPVLRMGNVGPAARCLVVCTTLGVFGTAHADGNLYLRLLSNLQAGEGPTVNLGDPVQILADDPAAVIQAHRSGMVSAINANSGIITCGIFGSVMWWPEAELRSCVGAAGMKLPSEERNRSFKTGRDNPHSAMSQVLRRYFTPSSAALAQATLQRMHSSGDLQGSGHAADLITQLEDSVDLDNKPSTAEQLQPVKSQHMGASSAGANGLNRPSPADPAAQQFMAEVSRILDEGIARQESNKEMTGKIAHVASVATLPSASSYQAAGSDRTSQESAGSSAFAGRASGPLEVAPILSGSPCHGDSLHRGAVQVAQPPPPSVPKQHTVQGTHSPDASTEHPPFTAARLTQHDAQQSAQELAHSELEDSSHGRSAQQQIPSLLQKSKSMDRDTCTQQEALQKGQMSSSSSSAVKLPSSLPNSLVEAEAAVFKRPAGSPADVANFTRNSGSSLSSSIFGEANQWVIDYNDLTFRKVIGEGSIGRVHLGRWQETDVAIKVLGHVPAQTALPVAAPMNSTGQMSAVDEDDFAEEATDDEDLGDSNMAATIRTLEREVSIMAAIRHPNVVLFMGVCLDPPCMVTEFCARGSMFDVLAKARSAPLLAQQLDWPKRVSMALDAAKGVLQLHSHKPPILHRDLKSPNLLVDKHWRVKIADFNLSRVMEAQSVVSSISANNPRWLAPEVVTDQEYSTAADVYSFGLILWELMTWQLPWAELGPFQIMVAITEKHRRPAIPPESELPGGSFPGLPAYLELMEACWHAEAEERPSFESCIITLRGLLEQTMTVKSKQKAAGHKTASPNRQAAAAPFGTAASSTAPSAPIPSNRAVPVDQKISSASTPGGIGVPDGFAQFDQNGGHSGSPRLMGSVQAAQFDLQQLQHNLLRPAMSAEGRLQSTGSDEAQPGIGGHPAFANDPSSSRMFPESADFGIASSSLNQQPAHVRSRDALLALQGQGAQSSRDRQRPGRMHEQQAVDQPLPQQPSDYSNQKQYQQGDDAQSDQQQSGFIAVPGRHALQSAAQDLFPGDLMGADSHEEQDHYEHPSRGPMYTGQDPLSRSGEEKEAEPDSCQAGAPQQLPPRRSRQSFGVQCIEGSDSSHMSPFAGFAALTKVRTSVDERQDHGSIMSGLKSHKVSLEQAVGRNKVLKTMPCHMRRSLESAPGVRRSWELRQPPPASSTGMRRSRDGKFAQHAEETPAQWDEQSRHSSLKTSQQQQQAGLTQGMTGNMSSIRETPSTSSSTDTDAPGVAQQPNTQPANAGAISAKHTHVQSPSLSKFSAFGEPDSGLSKYSPFASEELVSAPSFD